MPRIKTILLAALATAGFQATACAGWYEFWDRVHLDFHRNNCWFQPFVSVDRRVTREPFQVMITKGWQQQNTLGSHYFHPDTHVLTEAGERKIYWILTQAPEPYRTVFVVRPMDADRAEARIASIREAIERMLPDRAAPEIVLTEVEPRGWPAEYIDAIDRKLQASLPDPRLPGSTAVSGGGS